MSLTLSPFNPCAAQRRCCVASTSDTHTFLCSFFVSVHLWVRQGLPPFAPPGHNVTHTVTQLEVPHRCLPFILF